MAEYDSYSETLLNYASTSSDDIDNIDQMSNDCDAEKSPANRFKRNFDEIGDDSLNDEDFSSSPSSTSSLSDGDENHAKKRLKIKDESLQSYSNSCNTLSETIVTQPAIVINYACSPQQQQQQQQQNYAEEVNFPKIEEYSFSNNNCYTDYNCQLTSPSSASPDFLEFAEEQTINNLQDDTEWDTINISDLVLYLNHSNIMTDNNLNCQLKQQQQQQQSFKETNMYGNYYAENAYLFNQDHFLDEIISMMDDNSHYKR